jgi:probable F420-dependent oxidoreductase
MRRIGLCFVNPAPEIDGDFVPQLARKAEEIGVDSLWVIDRIAYDNLEPLCVLAAAAAVTRRIRLGTSVLLVATRHPALAAKAAATLDVLSGGRLTLGIGFGSRADDFAATATPFHGRGSRAAEAVQLIRRLWTGEKVTHLGRFFQLEGISVGPRPVQRPGPPIWMGGSVEPVLKRVATLADGYICGSSAIDALPSIWERISALAERAGRDPGRIEKAALTFMAIDDERRRAVQACEAYLARYYGRVRIDVQKQFAVGAPGACAERLNALFGRGVDTLIVGLVVPDLRQLERFGTEILPQLDLGRR